MHNPELGGQVISALDFQAGHRGFESGSVETILRPLVRLAHTWYALGWV